MTCRVLFVVLLSAGLVGVPGCDKKSGKGQPGVEKPAASKKAAGAGSVKAAAQGFVEAAGRRDKAGVIQMLLSDVVCKAQPARARTCREYVKELRKMVPEMMTGIPKGFTVERVEVKDMPGAGGQNVKLAMVHPKGGGNPVPLMVMEHDKRFYVGVGIKSKGDDKKPKQDPKK